MQASGTSLLAEAAVPVANWKWLADYLQVELDLAAVLTEVDGSWMA